jgi:hypothetical protein
MSIVKKNKLKVHKNILLKSISDDKLPLNKNHVVGCKSNQSIDVFNR